jgi:hypothetical protein
MKEFILFISLCLLCLLYAPAYANHKKIKILKHTMNGEPYYEEKLILEENI